jgi:release factor glutamine methyltransferase
MNITEAIGYAAARLTEATVENARREAMSLLTLVLQKDTTFLIAHGEYELTTGEAADFERALRRRQNREPFQYIAGSQEFYGLDFHVSPDVLIPRPETEILVEAAIEILSAQGRPAFCEIGVGSGCISVSVLHAIADATAVGVDISAAALAVAARNAQSNGVAERLTLREANLFDTLTGTFDLIVSNPPYIPDADIDDLQAEVSRFEPRTALAGGEDGLSIVRRIVAGAPAFLRPGGYLLIEIGFDQSGRVKQLFDPGVWRDIRLLTDLQGIERVVETQLRG